MGIYLFNRGNSFKPEYFEEKTTENISQNQPGFGKCSEDSKDTKEE
jgi:hypothetical protein